jgi:hypothetical protein
MESTFVISKIRYPLQIKIYEVRCIQEANWEPTDPWNLGFFANFFAVSSGSSSRPRNTEIRDTLRSPLAPLPLPLMSAGAKVRELKV